MPGPLH
jgi:hypothetical protein